MVELCRKSNYRVRNYSIKSFCFENDFGTRKSYRVHFIFIFYITLADLNSLRRVRTGGIFVCVGGRGLRGCHQEFEIYARCEAFG
jgi:hypothetical protein